LRIRNATRPDDIEDIGKIALRRAHCVQIERACLRFIWARCVSHSDTDEKRATAIVGAIIAIS
jgi:hypothetical protein